MSKGKYRRNSKSFLTYNGAYKLNDWQIRYLQLCSCLLILSFWSHYLKLLNSRHWHSMEKGVLIRQSQGKMGNFSTQNQYQRVKLIESTLNKQCLHFQTHIKHLRYFNYSYINFMIYYNSYIATASFHSGLKI